MTLFIDGKNCGECIGYHQIKSIIDFPHWLFTMSNGIYIKVPFVSIRRFTSNGLLEILTYACNKKGEKV